jgi:hypothetical protein
MDANLRIRVLDEDPVVIARVDAHLEGQPAPACLEPGKLPAGLPLSFAMIFTVTATVFLSVLAILFSRNP